MKKCLQCGMKMKKKTREKINTALDIQWWYCYNCRTYFSRREVRLLPATEESSGGEGRKSGE